MRLTAQRFLESKPRKMLLPERIDLCYEALEFHIVEGDKLVRDSILNDFIRGNDSRKLFFSNYEVMIGKWLRKYKVLGLSEDVIQNFMARTMLAIERQLEAYFEKVNKIRAEQNIDPKSGADSGS
jgi:hypothetical protein